MKFSCAKKDLVKTLTDISKAAVCSALPVLERVYIETGTDSVTLTCYNLEFALMATIPATVAQTGKIVVTSGGLRKMAKKMTGDILTITGLIEERAPAAEGKKPFVSYLIELSDDYARFKMTGMDADDYPQIPEIGQTKELDIPQCTLRSMLDQTLYAVAKVDAKPIHTGVLFDLAGGKLNLISVDGYRLALRQETVDSNDKISFVVPGLCLSNMVKLLSAKDKANARILTDSKYVIIEFGNYRAFSRLLVGDFMDYKGTIPNPTGKYVVLPVKELYNAIDRAIQISGSEKSSRRSPLRMVFGSDEISLAINAQTGEYAEEIRCESFGMDTEMIMGVIPNFLMDVLKILDCDKLRVELGSELSPMKLIPTDGDEKFVHLVLPFNLKRRQAA